MITKRNFLKSAAASALLPALGSPALADWRHGRPGFFAAKDIAEAAYIFGLPIVMNYGTMYEFIIDKNSGQYKAPFNTIYNEARVFTYEDTTIVTPNSDTPYSMLWLDLRAEPMVISLPDVEAKRYFSVQMVDGNTYNYGYAGSRATGNKAGRFLVAGPGWTGAAPEGIDRVFQSGTDFSLLIFRTQLFGPDDMPNVVKVQAGYKVEPLSTVLNQPAPPKPADPDWPIFDKAKVAENFLEYLDFALQFGPTRPNEAFILEQMGRIGVGPGKQFDFRDLSLADKGEILLGLAEGKRKIDEAAKTFGTEINGWSVGSAFGNEAFYHGDWELRAIAAQAGIYGNDAEEAMYPVTRKDGKGDTIDTSSSNYTITFKKGELPPVNAFWSITMYDGKTQLLIKNPINRYLINAPMLPDLKTDADGSLTLYIQNKSPGKDKEANWLPAPDGPVYLVMRLYWPKVEAPSILPPGKGSWDPPPVVKAG